MNISTFETIIQIYQRYIDDGSSLINLEVHVKNVMDYFDTKRKLGDATNTIVDSFISEGREVMEVSNKDGGLDWLKQELVVTWQEHDLITYAE